MEAETWGLVWLITAAVFLGGEMLIPGFILLPFGVSAAVAAVLGFAGVDPAIGWLVFVFGGLIGFGLLYKFARHSLAGIPMPKGVGADRLIGETGTVVGSITGGATGSGLVQLGAEQWRAEAADERPLAEGIEVEVVEVKGTRVLVRPLSQEF